jgi:hypothetical protein
MTIEDRVRDALHDYADPIEPVPGSWERISARFDDGVGEMHAPPRSRRPLVLAGTAIALVVLLVAGLVLRDDDRGNRVATTGSVGMPSRILAVTSEGRPQIIDAVSGARLRDLASAPVLPGRQIAVTPDGRDAYVVAGSGDGCADTSIQGLRLAGGFGVSIPRATAPAVSSDGRYLAYLQCPLDAGQPDAILLRDLRTGEEQDFRSPAGTVFGDALVFAEPGRLLFETQELGSGRTAPMALDLATGVMDAGRPPVTADAPEVALPAPPDLVVGDATGRHFVAVVGETLYRWSVGDDEPTKVADGIVTAAWIPDGDAAPKPAADMPKGIAVVRTDGRIADISPVTGAEHSTLGQAAPDAAISAAPDGRTIAVASETRTPGCANPISPRLELWDVVSGARRGVASGAYSPAIGPNGLAAFGISCDGDGLGMTRLATGENYRSDALGGRETESDPRIASVSPLGWSPDGTRLLYWVGVDGENRRRLYVGKLWPAVRAAQTEVTEVPDSDRAQAAAFVDDETLAVAERESPTQSSTTVRFVRLAETAGAFPGPFEIPGYVGSLVADPRGRHLLAVNTDGDLYRWSVHDQVLTKLAEDVTAATWLPW